MFLKFVSLVSFVLVCDAQHIQFLLSNARSESSKTLWEANLSECARENMKISGGYPIYWNKGMLSHKNYKTKLFAANKCWI